MIMNNGRNNVLNEVVDKLRILILSDECEENEKIPAETKLADRFGVARPTIREACRILEAKGYVQRVPDRGVFVVSKNPSGKGEQENTVYWFEEHKIEQENILKVRLVLESLAIEEVVRNKTWNSTYSALSENYKRFLGDGFVPSNAEYYTWLDEEFHRIIWNASRNEFLIHTCNSVLIPVLRDMRLNSLKEEVNWQSAAHAHEKILYTIKKGNPTQIIKEFSDHIRQVSALFYQITK